VLSYSGGLPIKPEELDFFSIYGPVKSWRNGTSLGIDPIGKVSTCSFNCSYCQLGQIENISTEIKVYVKTEKILNDLDLLYQTQTFNWKELDVITFAGSGEPSLAENLGEIIHEIKKKLVQWQLKIPISILSNASLFENKQVRDRALLANFISLKLDAPDEQTLATLNQAAKGIQIARIIEGIKKIKEESHGRVKLQLQIMFLPNYLKQKNYLEKLSERIIETGINRIQINTPSRPVPKFKKYNIETRGNHYAQSSIIEEDLNYTYLPIISPEEAWEIEDKLKKLLESSFQTLEIINVHQRN
jgi:wyosine [tRNA(Phe)-imidazoG37] synthetase (radical SAM superfamily)